MRRILPTEHGPSANDSSMCSRRTLVTRAALAGAVALLHACSNSEPLAPSDTDAVMVQGDDIIVRVDRLASLATITSAYVIGELNVVILRLGEREYRAFSNICTHAGCGIFHFERERLRCQCHGSEFDTRGLNVVGPALEPLSQFRVTLSEDARELRIRRNERIP